MTFQQQQISIVRSGKIERADIYYKTAQRCTLKIVFLDQQTYEVTDNDLFTCFCTLRNHFSAITFLCKGAKQNVYPSNMARDMAKGLVAYEYHKGKHASLDDLVSIFDFDDKDIVSPEQQRENFLAWIKSERI